MNVTQREIGFRPNEKAEKEDRITVKVTVGVDLDTMRQLFGEAFVMEQFFKGFDVTVQGIGRLACRPKFDIGDKAGAADAAQAEFNGKWWEVNRRKQGARIPTAADHKAFAMAIKVKIKQGLASDAEVEWFESYIAELTA